MIGKPVTTSPCIFESELQRCVYEKLMELGVEFVRVDTDGAVTMDDCREIDEALDVETVKTLFLTNRQKTAFYLFVTAGSKPFVTKDFSRALGVARVSFAPAEMMMDMLGMPVGGASPLCAVKAPYDVRFVFDAEIAVKGSFGCNDCTPNSYMRIDYDDLSRYLESCGHLPEIISL